MDGIVESIRIILHFKQGSLNIVVIKNLRTESVTIDAVKLIYFSQIRHCIN
jgi:hypothetical protein